MNKRIVKAWVQASRLPFYVATFIPLLIGWLLAVRDGGRMEPARFSLVLAGSLIVHLITNLANDYFDHLVGTDSGEAIGGSRVLQEGKIRPETMFRVIMVLYILAFIIAFIIIFGFKLYLLAIPIFFAAFSSYYYVAPPIRYGYYGFGELFVAINMGPIMLVGTYWVITGHPRWTPFLISIPIGLMVASILYFQSLPDMKTDAAADKRTLAVRLGRRSAFLGLTLFFFAIFTAITLLILFRLLSCYSLFFLLSIPLALRVLLLAHRIDNWVLLDQYGKYVRFVYFVCGLAVIAGILFP